MQLAARLAEEAQWSDPETLLGVAFVVFVVMCVIGVITWIGRR